MRRLYILLGAALMAASLMALTVGSAGAKSAGKPYAALAVSPSVLGVAYGDGYTKTEAQRKALKSCRKEAPKYSGYTGDCQGASWVKNGYVAVAFEKTLEKPYATAQWGSDYDRRKSYAKYYARTDCYYKADETCKVAYWAKAPDYNGSLATGGNW